MSVAASIPPDHIQKRLIFPISVETYHRASELGLLGEDVELLDGILTRKMPKSPQHELIVRRLRRILTDAIDKSERGCFVAQEAPISTEFSEPEPDLAVIEGTEEDYFDHHPATALLVIEVAVTSQVLDQSKVAVYANAGVQEYWLVDVPAASIAVHSQPEPNSGSYQSVVTFSGSATVNSNILPGCSVTLPELVERAG